MGFRGSYSAVWSPAGFWEPDTPLQGRKLRLYLLPSSAQVRLTSKSTPQCRPHAAKPWMSGAKVAVARDGGSACNACVHLQ